MAALVKEVGNVNYFQGFGRGSSEGVRWMKAAAVHQ